MAIDMPVVIMHYRAWRRCLVLSVEIGIVGSKLAKSVI